MPVLSVHKNAASPRLRTPVQPSASRCPRELLRVFLQLLPFAEIFDLPSLAGKRFYERIFCPVVTLWYFIFQRLQSDHSLQSVLSDVHNGGADALRPGLSIKLISTATTSFSDARKRLPLDFLSDVLKLQARRIPALTPDAVWRGFQVGLHVLWTHSRHDQLQPGLCADPIPGRLLVVKLQRNGFRTQRLFLFTTLIQGELYPAPELAQLYAVRWNIELNLRYLKTQMHMEQLECKSAQMAKKEWFAGLLAYNLVRASMLCAALRSGVSALCLSFSFSCRHLINWLARWSQNVALWAEDWEKLLDLIARARLPKRSRPRPAEPRAQRHLRQSFPPLIGSRADARKQLAAQINEC